MNKIKIMLSAITIFAVVGGALAFKAKSPVDLYCSDTAAQGAGIFCPTKTTSYTTLDVNEPIPNIFCGTTRTSCDLEVTAE